MAWVLQAKCPPDIQSIMSIIIIIIIIIINK